MGERRRFIRLSSSLNIAYSKCNSSDKERLSFSKDISKGGICLIIDEKLGKSDLLDLKIYLPRDETPINATGRVVWINKFATVRSAKEKKFYAGIQFTKIDEQGGKKIDEYISFAI